VEKNAINTPQFSSFEENWQVNFFYELISKQFAQKRRYRGKILVSPFVSKNAMIGFVRV